MAPLDSQVFRAAELCNEGRHAEALPLLQQSLAEAEREPAPGRPRMFMTLFQWKRLAQAYAPARAALHDVRDDQVRRLLAGDLHVGRADPAAPDADLFRRTGRFSLIVEMNQILQDPQSTHALFAQLQVTHPELAHQYAFMALPDIVSCGDFALADRYRGRPLDRLDDVNAAARTRPLFPAPGTAPRLAAELTGLVGEVRIGIAVLRGLGAEAQASALGEALLAGLESDALRALAQRELLDPGTITRVLTGNRRAPDGAGRARSAGRVGHSCGV